MLVGRLGETNLIRFSRDSFFVGNDGFRLLDFAIGVFLLEIVQTDFDVEFTATSDNVLSVFFVDNEDQWVRLGEFIETIDKLGEILGILWLNSDSDDWRDGVFHNSDVVGIIVVRDSTSLDEELINTDESDSVTAWDIWDVFDGSTHHKNGSLDGFNVKIFLLAWLVVGTHDSDLLSRGDGSGENSTESEESSLIGGWHHLGDVEHKGTLGVAVSDTFSTGIILGTFVEESDSVLLGGLGGWEMENHHFKKSISSREPVGHDGLEELFALKILIFRGEVQVDSGEHLVHLFSVSFHDGSGELDDWFHTELDESSFEGLAGFRDWFFEPFLGFRIEERVTPKFLH
jgi:hypothetical protein